MTKRKAEYQLDRDNFNEQALNSKTNDNELADDGDKICTTEEISQRKIYRAKRTIPQTKETTENNQSEKGRFKLLGSLSQSPSKNKQENSTDNGNNDKSKESANSSDQPSKFENSESSEHTESKSKSPFGSANKDSSGSSVFLNKQSDNEKKNIVSIFGKPSVSSEVAKTSNFGKKNESQNEEEKDKKTGLFSFNVKPTTENIFSKKVEANSQEVKPNLFASSNKGVNIFSKKSSNNPETKESEVATKPTTDLFSKSKTDDKKDEGKKFTSLFGNQKKDDSSDKPATGGLFGVNKSGPLFAGTKSLFSGPSLFSGVHNFAKPEDQKKSFISSGNKDEEGEGEEDEEDKNKEDDKPKFAAISKDPYTKIYNKQVEKFNANKTDKGNGFISIETGETDGKKFVIFNFRNTIGKTLFTGQIYPKCKKIDVIDKLGKIQTKVMIIEKNSKNEFKAVPSIITFMRTDDKVEFDKKWEEAKSFLEEAK